MQNKKFIEGQKILCDIPVKQKNGDIINVKVQGTFIKYLHNPEHAQINMTKQLDHKDTIDIGTGITAVYSDKLSVDNTNSI